MADGDVLVDTDAMLGDGTKPGSLPLRVRLIPAV